MPSSNRSSPSEALSRAVLRYPVTLRLLTAAAAAWTAAAWPAPDAVILAVAGWATVLGIIAWSALSRGRAHASVRRSVLSALALCAVFASLAALAVGTVRSVGVPDDGRLSGQVRFVSDPVRSASGVYSAAVLSAEGPVTLMSRTPLPAAGSRCTVDVAVHRSGAQARAFLTEVRDVTPPAGLWQVRAQVRAGLTAAVGTDTPGAALVPGLVLGDRSHTDAQVLEDMRTVSLTHVSAVSGTHVAIVALTALTLARFVTRRTVLAIGCAVGLVACFVFLAGPAPSVIRAAGMGLVGAVVAVRGMGRRGAAVIAAAIIGVLITRPALATSVGFILSVCAAGSLVLLSQPVTALLCRWLPQFWANLLAVPLCAQLGVFPVLTVIDQQPSAWALPANVVAVPALGPAVIGGLLTALAVLAHALTGLAVFTHLAAGLGWAVRWPGEWIALVSRTAAALPGASLPWLPGVLGALCAGLTALALAGMVLLWPKPRLRALTAALAAAALCTGFGAGFVRERVGPWTAAFCDVGQGSAAAVNLGSRHVLLLDAGPDERLLDVCLTRLGAQRVSVIISHFDSDHYAGLPGAGRRQRTIERIWAAAPGLADPRARAVERDTGKVLEPVSAGMAFSAGDVRWDVLWPLPSAEQVNDARNALSAVVRVEVRGMTLLVTGDVEEDGQREMAAQHIRADLLVAPHHGSRFIDPGFFIAAEADVGIISVGAHNRYGHPSREALAAFGSIPVLRTDTCGTVIVTPSGALHSARGCRAVLTPG